MVSQPKLFIKGKADVSYAQETAYQSNPTSKDPSITGAINFAAATIHFSAVAFLKEEKGKFTPFKITKKSIKAVAKIYEI